MGGPHILRSRHAVLAGVLVLVFFASSFGSFSLTGPRGVPEPAAGPRARELSPGMAAIVSPPETLTTVLSASPSGGGAPVAASRETSASTAPVAPSAQASPEILTGWDGLHYGLTPTYHPPDVQVAAGPNYVVEMVNLLMGVYTKQGQEVYVTSLYTFFNAGSDFVSDPKVQYDAANGRWFATLADVTTGQVLMAVSATSDPMGSWHQTRIPSTSTGDCLDQPILGVGSTTVIVSVNVFSQTKSNPCTTPYQGAQYWVVNKADLMNGVSPPATYASPIDSTQFSIHPVQVEGNSAVHYMITTFGLATGATSSTLELFTVSGTPPGAVTVLTTSFSMPVSSAPPPATQPGRNVPTIDAGDNRVNEAVWAGGKLWVGFDEACLSDATRACVRLAEIDTTAGVVLQDFDIDLAGRYVFYPAFRMDGMGDLAVVFGYSSASDYPGLMWTGRLPGDPLNTLQAPLVIVQGTGLDTYSTCSGTCRYGDYFGAGLDPSNASVVWLAGEYGTSSDWGTYIFASAVKAVLMLDYHILDGGSGYALPALTYTSNGTLVTAPLSAAPTPYYADPGSSWRVTTVISNRAAQGEFWSLNTQLANPPYGGEANASLAANYTYYHGYSVRLGYDVRNWDPGVAIPSAAVNVTQFGEPSAVPAGERYILDAGTGYAYENPLGGATATERVVGAGPLDGTATGPLNLTVEYFHQVRVTFDYVAPSGAVGLAPTVRYSGYGANTSATANATVWADVGGSYAYEEALTGASSEVRIGAGNGAVGNVTGPGTITVVYQTQYRLAILVEPGSLAGSVSGGGWYNAGAVAAFQAYAPAGWEFRGWSGNVTGVDASQTVTMTSPVTVVALFYAGLIITAGSGGSVDYAYGTSVGSVTAGSSVTIYVPIGTQVNLTASPSSLTQAFVAWGGAATGDAGKVSVTVNGPAIATATFGPNPWFVAGGAISVVIVLAVVLALYVRRRRRREPPTRVR